MNQTIEMSVSFRTVEILSFPTKEMAEEFIHYYKDLLEKVKYLYSGC